MSLTITVHALGTKKEGFNFLGASMIKGLKVKAVM